MGVRTAVLLVAAFALVFGSGMALLEAVEDRSAGLLWVSMGLFYALFFVAQSFVVPWLTCSRTRSPTSCEGTMCVCCSPDSGGQSALPYVPCL